MTPRITREILEPEGRLSLSRASICLSIGKGIVSISISEVVPKGPTNQFPLFEEQPARGVAKGNPPDHTIAKRMGASIHAVDSSHVPMLSRPGFVIDVIRAAAKAVQG